MSKKFRKGVFKEEAFREPPLTVVSLPHPVREVIVPLGQAPTESGTKDIYRKEISSLKSNAAELALVEAELEKPMLARNKALMDRFGYNAGGVAHVDAYPPLDQSWKIRVSAPEDITVGLEQRPTPWYGTVTIRWAASTFQFRFPYHRVGDLYKLDGYPVWLDPKSGLIDASSEYGLYQALYDQAHGVSVDAAKQAEIFRKYGILQADGGLDFRVRGQGFGVSYVRDESPQQAPLVIPQADVQTLAEADAQSPPQDAGPWFIDDVTPANFLANANPSIVGKVMEAALRSVARVGHIPFVGLTADESKSIPSDRLLLERVISNPTITDKTTFLLNSFNPANGVWGLVVINGWATAAGLMRVPKKAADVLAWVSAANKTVYAEGMSGGAGISSVLQ